MTGLSLSPPVEESVSTGKKINISTALVGQTLGIKEVDEGIWLVSFMDYDLGHIDLEQRSLQPIDNPFGPGVSPTLSPIALATGDVLGTLCYLCLRYGPRGKW